MDVADLYAAAAHSGLLTPVKVGTVTVQCAFRAPDEDVLGGLMLSRDYTIEYPAAEIVLQAGEVVEIAGVAYRVREVRAMRDGSECRATLAQSP
jgi:hypothetical protein